MKGQETNNSAIRTVITIVILALATLFSLAIEAFGVRIENIVLVYTVALMIFFNFVNQGVLIVSINIF
ncbi:MAG: hypothetical protein IIW27_03820 [Clostridia bacterium]|nr:hypothetical protein [Clostridia bacterium]